MSAEKRAIIGTTTAPTKDAIKIVAMHVRMRAAYVTTLQGTEHDPHPHKARSSSTGTALR